MSTFKIVGIDYTQTFNPNTGQPITAVRGLVEEPGRPTTYFNILARTADGLGQLSTTTITEVANGRNQSIEELLNALPNPGTLNLLEAEQENAVIGKDGKPVIDANGDPMTVKTKSRALVLTNHVAVGKDAFLAMVG